MDVINIESGELEKMEIIKPDEKLMEIVREIMGQNKFILEMNERMLRGIMSPMAIISKK